MAWSESEVLLLYLNFSTLSVCLMVHWRMPLISFTTLCGGGRGERVQAGDREGGGLRGGRSPNLLQLVGLGLVFVPVGVLSVGQAEGPDGQDAVDVVPHPRVRLLGPAGEETGHRVLPRQAGRSEVAGGKHAEYSGFGNGSSDSASVEWNS